MVHSFEMEYLYTIAEETYLLRQTVDRLRSTVFPSTGLATWVSSDLARTIDHIWGCVEKQISVWTQEEDSSIRLECRKAIEVWQFGAIQDIVTSVSKADMRSHPIEIMLFIHDLISSLEPGAQYEIVTIPQEEFNFSFREMWLWLRGMLENDLGIKELSGRHYIELSYPAAEKDNVLLGSIYAHELGHYVDRLKSLSQSVFAKVVLRHRALGELEKLVISTDKNRVPSQVDLLAALHESVIGHWLAEAVADCFAIRTLGPAFFLAHADVQRKIHGRLLEDGVKMLDSRSLSHPRPSLRMEYQMDLLKGMLTNIPDPMTYTMERIVQTWKGQKTVQEYGGGGGLKGRGFVLWLTPQVYSILEGIWKDCLAEVTRVVDEVVSDESRFTQQDFDLADRLAEERIAWMLPPNELEGVPMKARVVINSGWIAKLGFIDVMGDRVASVTEGLAGQHELVDIINGLLRYALHSSYIHQRWSTA